MEPLTGRDIVFRALGVSAEIRTDHEAVEAELRERERHGLRVDDVIRAQLVAKHTHGEPLPHLDFCRTEYDPATSEARQVTDYNALHEFTSHLRMQTAVRDRGPGSGVAMYQGGQWTGDPAVVERIKAGEAERAALAAQQQAAQDAAARRFAGPYSIFGSVR